MKSTSSLTASLPLQILLFYNPWLILAYFVVSCATFIYKATELPYPNYLVGWEVSALVLLMIMDVIRVRIGSRANRMRAAGSMTLFLILSIVVLIVNVYYAQWQTYVLRIDLAMHVLSVVVVGLEIVFGLFATITYATAS